MPSYSLAWAFPLAKKFAGKMARLLTPILWTMRLPTAAELPMIRPTFVENVDPLGPFRAKSASEFRVNPVVAAIANAVYAAVGVRLRELPHNAREGLAGPERKTTRMSLKLPEPGRVSVGIFIKGFTTTALVLEAGNR